MLVLVKRLVGKPPRVRIQWRHRGLLPLEASLSAPPAGLRRPSRDADVGGCGVVRPPMAELVVLLPVGWGSRLARREVARELAARLVSGGEWGSSSRGWCIEARRLSKADGG